MSKTNDGFEIPPFTQLRRWLFGLLLYFCAYIYILTAAGKRDSRIDPF